MGAKILKGACRGGGLGWARQAFKSFVRSRERTPRNCGGETKKLEWIEAFLVERATHFTIQNSGRSREKIAVLLFAQEVLRSDLGALEGSRTAGGKGD